MPKTLRTQTGYALTAKDDGKTLELNILDYIGKWDGEVSAKDVIVKLLEYPSAEMINVTVTSGGGDVYEGLAIYDALIEHPATVNMHGLGIVASIASVIFMAGDIRQLSANCDLMIHNASLMTFGSKDDVEKTLDRLKSADERIAKIYATRCNVPIESIRDMMDATTFLSAPEALEKGFITEVSAAVKVAAVMIPTDLAVVDTKPVKPQKTAITTTEQPAKQAGKQEDITMSVTLKEIVAACKGLDRTKPDDAQFIMDQQDADADIQAVQSAWADTLNARIEAREKELADREAAHAQQLEQIQNTNKSAGNKAIGEQLNGKKNQAQETGDPLEDFHGAVTQKMAAGIPRDKAILLVAKADPKLHQNYLLACNKTKAAKRKLEEKYDDPDD